MQVACAKGLIQLKEGEKSGREDRGAPSLLTMVAFPSDTNRGQYWPFHLIMDFPGGSDSKASAYSSGEPGSIPGSGRSPGDRNGNPLAYSCLENSMERGVWRPTVHGVAKSRTRLSDFTFFHFLSAAQEAPNRTSTKAVHKGLHVHYPI